MRENCEEVCRLKSFTLVKILTCNFCVNRESMCLLHKKRCAINAYIKTLFQVGDRLCGLVVRVSGYRSKIPGFDSRRFQIF
jgi:hypothetical protein